MRFSELKTDPVKELEGIWHEFGGGVRFKIASASNKKYSAWIERELLKKYRQQIRMDTLEAEVRDRIVHEGMARFIFLDWENLDDDDGKPMPYSVEKAIELLQTSVDVFRFVDERSSATALYRQQIREESLKN